jgi:hypothetical protein
MLPDSPNAAVVLFGSQRFDGSRYIATRSTCPGYTNAVGGAGSKADHLVVPLLNDGIAVLGIVMGIRAVGEIFLGKLGKYVWRQQRRLKKGGSVARNRPKWLSRADDLRELTRAG